MRGLYRGEWRNLLPQGTLDLVILKAAATGPIHGYTIAQRLQQVSRDVVQVPQGSLYPVFTSPRKPRPAGGGLEGDGNRARGQVLLSDAEGRAQLEMEAASLRRLTEAVGLILTEGGAQ